MTTPKVSVIIPTYNAMRYLPETMETALAQTMADFEVIVVNDGSTDSVIEWVAQITDPRVRIISQVNQGLSGARNTGVKNAKGEYVAFLDADDLWKPTKLEKQVACMESNPQVGLVYTWTAMADQNGKPTGRVIASEAEGDVWQQLIEFNMVCCGSTPLIRRSCFEQIGSFAADVSPSDDWDMWLRIATQYKFGVVKEPLILYRQHPGNSSKNLQRMLETSRILIERTFATAPTELLHLRNRSYGSICLYLGWRAIETLDTEQAMHFRQQACAHRPQLSLSPRCVRLGLAILLARRFGPQTYTKVLHWIYRLRRSLAGTG
jgi:glycosyltransferase involved in cell wall biosynthesis